MDPIEILKWVLMVAGIFPTVFGLFVLFHIMRPQHSPADTSNRINKFRLVWFALTREELFVNTPGLTWLKNDELDNLSKSRKSRK